MSATIALIRTCASCKRVTRHEELTGDNGRRLPDKRILICDNCGIVGVE